MAFNFNWSPLIADTTRAKDMLTAALNKSPKPAIIVDDIIVSELNLGSTPPELEILEIGDLAEDRFRGIFKMSYSGDAFLTLKTRVQANPLNTYLSNKPSFASPQPLAAASSLTIPLSITLSDFRLSGFVILVFSRQKGMTIVFRNDPLESLKVSSTFDSIPFVRDYLQKEIEGQLRVLFMEDLPAILHRLSLKLWSTDYQDVDNNTEPENGSVPVDPLASPPQDPVDAQGNPIDEAEGGGWSLDNPTEIHASFSAKNLLRLAALNDSQRTLSLFTPSIQDAVYRAWAGAAERGERAGFASPPLTRFSLSRMQSTLSTVPSSTPSMSASSDAVTASSTRPSLSSYGSSYNAAALNATRSRAGQAKKRKRRVVNLRGSSETAGEVASQPNTSEALSTPTMPAAVPEYPVPAAYAEELTSPPRPHHRSPPKEVRFRRRQDSEEVFANPGPSRSPERNDEFPTPRPSACAAQSYIERPSLYRSQPSQSSHVVHHPSPLPPASLPLLRTFSLDRLQSQQSQSQSQSRSHSQIHASSSRKSLSPPPPFLRSSPTLAEASMSSMASTGGILEQAWMNKMAREIARKVAEERERAGQNERQADEKMAQGFWRRVSSASRDGELPPPAYVE